MTLRQILKNLKKLKNLRNIEGMARFGIRGRNILGVSKPSLKRMARKLGKDHGLAQKLWASEIHEARILACLVDLPGQVTSAQMERWSGDFDSWDICDQVCIHLFDRSPLAVEKAKLWSGRKREFEKRAGFVLMGGWRSMTKKPLTKCSFPFYQSFEGKLWMGGIS